MVQEWPDELQSAYCLAILDAGCKLLDSLQSPAAADDVTVNQLCQAMGCTADLTDLASCVQQLAAIQVALCSCKAREVFPMLQPLFSVTASHDCNAS